MKKILAFFVAAACAVSAMATNYEGELTVAINEETTAMGTTSQWIRLTQVMT